MEFVDEQKIFVENSLEDNTQSLADYLPSGEFFRAKNIKTSNFRSLLEALAYEFGRAEAKLKELVDEYYIPETYNLIEEWERALGIPDTCFKVANTSIEMRRKQCVAKLALMNLTTTQDFIDLAAFFGYVITITNGEASESYFPYTFPLTFNTSSKTAKFTMIVTFHGLSPTDGFPYTFPFVFEEDPSNMIICLFNKLKPAPVIIKVRYAGQGGAYMLENGAHLLLQNGGLILLGT